MKKKKGLFRLLASLFCAGMMGFGVFAMFGNVGYAATSGTLDCDVNGLTLSYSGTADNAWSVGDGKIVGKAQSSKGTCSTDHFNSTLNITATSKGEVSFDYTIDLQDGTIKVDGTAVTANGTFSPKEIESNQSIQVSLTSASTSSPTKITISNLTFKSSAVAKVTVRFASNENCTYTAMADDEVIAVRDEDVEGTTQNKFTVKKATVKEGFKLTGWLKNDEYYPGDSLEFTLINEGDKAVVSPNVVEENDAVFSVGSSLYSDLQKAIEAAGQLTDSVKLITVRASGTIFPKSDGTAYEFKDGVSLFLQNEEKAKYQDYVAEHPKLEAKTNRVLKFRLTLSPNVQFVFNQSSFLCVAGKSYCATGGGLTSLPSGNVAELKLEEKSSVLLRGGSSFYCWGYASGSGEIHAENGAYVYEGYSFLFRGGSATLLYVHEAFKFSQYYIQNIEANLRMDYGATEKCFVAAKVSSEEASTSFTFIGSDGMFSLKENSYVVKYYDPKTDRLSMTVYGDGVLSHIKVSISSLTIDSTDYDLPINNNMDIRVAKGTVTIEQDLDFLPLSTLTIDAGAKLVVGSGKKLIFYDLSNWKGKGYAFTNTDISPIGIVSPSAQSDYDKVGRANHLNGGSVLTLNGTIENTGGIYVTKSDTSTQSPEEMARIVSDGGGRFTVLGEQFDSAGKTSATTFQFVQSGSRGSDTTINTSPAVFMNTDQSLFSGTCPVSSSLVHKNGKWMVEKAGVISITITFEKKDGTTLGTKDFDVDEDGITLPNETGFSDSSLGTIFLWLLKDDEGRSYQPSTSVKTIREDVTLIAFTGGWYTDLNKDTYYYDPNQGKITGLFYVTDTSGKNPNTYCFDESGILEAGDEIYFSFEKGPKYAEHGDGKLYLVRKGVVVKNAGLIQKTEYVSSSEVEISYYYFGSEGYAYQNRTVYLSSGLNNLLSAGTYTFGSDSKLATLECSNFTHVDEVTLQNGACYYGDIKAGIGLFESDGHIYYAKDDGSILKDATYYVVDGKLNGQTDAEGSALKEGLYYFDSNGYLCDSSLKPISKEAQA